MQQKTNKKTYNTRGFTPLVEDTAAHGFYYKLRNRFIKASTTSLNILFWMRKKPAVSFTAGFTLVETLISILIFSSSVVVIISVTSKGLNDVVQVKNKLAATYLAEEGIESIRSIRDKEVASLGTQGWMQFMTDVDPCTTVNNGCTVTLLPNPQVIQCISGASDPCKVGALSDTGLYVPSNWMFVTDPTPYYRKVTVDQEGTVGEVKVISEVTWTQGLAIGSVKLEEYLYNW